MALTNVRAPPVDDSEGKGTHFVAIVNSLVDVLKEVFDSFNKAGGSVHCHWGEPDLTTASCSVGIVGCGAPACAN